ncbi:MAG: peptidoglycan DD-metalloendopeptidase family protein [Flavobacteriales bacterium]
MFKNKKFIFITVLIILLLGVILVNQTNIFSKSEPASEVSQDTLPKETFEYGMRTDTFTVHKSKIETNEIISSLLSKYKIPQEQIYQLVNQSKPIFDIERNLIAGKKYAVFCSKDSLGKAQCFIYEPNAFEYVVFDLRDSIQVYKKKKEIKKEIKTASGVITSSLYKTLQDANISPVLAIELSNVYAWAIDFYRIQKNDWFKVVYEEKSVEGKSIGIGRIISAQFNHGGKDFYAHLFNQDGIPDYFDEKANSLRKAFLKSPLKFGRLTSGFTMKRFHPVQKINKAHLGTDYAAPKGTPILATGNGTVIESAYGVFNGNYVKIKHNSTYTTQYLHMSKRGVNKGQSVKQGDVIGYVGSTGLATGPHVCYRFWKNGKQTNHLAEEFPTSEPIKPNYKDSFNLVMKENIKKLDAITVKKKK